MRPIALGLAAAFALFAIPSCGSSGPSAPAGPPGDRTGGVYACDPAQKPVGQSLAPLAARLTPPGAPARVGTVLSFTVPAGTASVTIVEQAVSAPDTVAYRGRSLPNTAVPLEVRGPGPDRELWFEDGATPAEPEAALGFFASSAPATGTLTLPNTSAGLARVGAGALPAGTWSVTVSDLAYACSLPRDAAACGASGNTVSTYDVTVVARAAAPGGGIPPAGTLDVTLHVVGTETADPGRPLPTTAAALSADPDLQRLAATLRSLYAESGLTIGAVRFAEVPDAVRTRYPGLVDIDSASACAPLAQLLRLGADGTSVPVFLVNGFTAAGLPAGALLAGVDGTVPGPATVGSTVASGVAVSTGDLRKGRCAATDAVSYSFCGDDFTALVVAHEIGHFLGLYHVTEVDGLLFDPLADTPRCDCSSCRPATAAEACASDATGHAMVNAECAGAGALPGCGGGDNLMFWRLPTLPAPLTAEQQRVIRASPLVR